MSAASSAPARKHACAATSTAANTGATRGPTSIPSAPDNALAWPTALIAASTPSPTRRAPSAAARNRSGSKLTSQSTASAPSQRQPRQPPRRPPAP